MKMNAILLLSIVLLQVSSFLAGSAHAEQPAVAAPPRAWVDAIPVGPSVAERLAQIRQRIDEVLVYPTIAKMRNIDGVVTLQFQIGADRKVKQLRVHESSGYPSLDQAALTAASKVEKLPYVVGKIRIPVHFILK